MKTPKKGTHIVLSNGSLSDFNPELEGVFNTKEAALEFINSELARYSDMEYYLCPITELHYAELKLKTKKI